jgi:hypothetical protein
MASEIPWKRCLFSGRLKHGYEIAKELPANSRQHICIFTKILLVQALHLIDADISDMESK